MAISTGMCLYAGISAKLVAVTRRNGVTHNLGIAGLAAKLKPAVMISPALHLFAFNNFFCWLMHRATTIVE